MPYFVTNDMIEEFELPKAAKGRNILQNSFDVNKRSLVVTDASGDEFGHILLQHQHHSIVMSVNIPVKQKRT